MRQISKEELKCIQLSLLDSFVKICEEKGLKYFLDYGTLLGCIRHKGFIPWDDDIDVSMPRNDYNKIKKFFESNETLFGGSIKLAYIGGKYNVYKPYYNLIDIRTITESRARREKYYYPVWIDIFPMDYVPNNRKKIINIYKETNRLRMIGFYPMTKATGRFSIIESIIQFLLRPFSNMFMRLAEKKVSHWNDEENIIMYYHPYNIFCSLEKRDFYEKNTMGLFEGKQYKIPVNFHDRLTRIYGDYTKLPPEEKRIPHTFKAYWRS